MLENAREIITIKGFEFALDEQKRVVEIRGALHKKPKRDQRSSGLNDFMPYDTFISKDYIDFRGRGHFIALLLGGPETPLNSFMQNSIVNSGSYQAAELEALHKGSEVHLKMHYIDSMGDLTERDISFMGLDRILPQMRFRQTLSAIQKELEVYRYTPRIIEYAITDRDNPYKQSLYRLPNPLLTMELAAQKAAMQILQRQKDKINKIRPKSLEGLLSELPDHLEAYECFTENRQDDLLANLVTLAHCKKRKEYFHWYKGTPHDDVREFLDFLQQTAPEKKVTAYFAEQYRQAVAVFEAINRDAIDLAIPEILEKYSLAPRDR